MNMSINFRAEDQFIEADTLIKENRIEESVNLLIMINILIHLLFLKTLLLFELKNLS